MNRKEFYKAVSDYEESHLEHYGIAGQEWGKRRWQNKDGTFNEAGKERYFGKSKKDDREPEFTKKQRVVATAKGIRQLVLRPLRSSVKELSARSKRNSVLNARKTEKFDKEAGLYIKNEDGGIKKDASLVNPMFKSVLKHDFNTQNCQYCSIAYDLRRRGYEVMANERVHGGSVDWFRNIYKPPAKTMASCPGNKEYTESEWMAKKHKASKKEKIKALEDGILKTGGTRGEFSFIWKNGYGGHSMQYEVENGVVNIIDAQSGKVYNGVKKFFSKGSGNNTSGYYLINRLDNLEPDYERINKIGVIK